jgi:hypothetical protein
LYITPVYYVYIENFRQRLVGQNVRETRQAASPLQARPETVAVEG